MIARKFSPTPELIRMAEWVMVAMAMEDTIRPVVEAYERAILAKHQFRIDPKWVEAGYNEDCLILERNKTFLLADEDAKLFYAECFAARDAAGIKVSDPENCPLCVAQHNRCQAENALIDALATFPGLESLGTGGLYGDSRRKVIELGLKLLAPFCADGPAILERICANDPNDKKK